MPSILAWERVEALPEQIAVFDHVFWEPDDTRSQRELLRSTDLVHGKSVLEIGTGSGIVSLCCSQAGASRIVATDINPWAVRNAVYNAGC
ncbi:MAG: 50S ribosomal protein L11 methyltransferase [Fuerstiella sp.]|nr:50S ribosomal protein L11 methyltransferase [Fuerstiella sp.]